MAGIVGIAKPGHRDLISKWMKNIEHRGNDGEAVIEDGSATFGEVRAKGAQKRKRGAEDQMVVFDGAIYNWKKLVPSAPSVHHALRELYAKRGPEFVRDLDGPFALAMTTDDGLFIARGFVGVAPLYYADCGGVTCFASEVKALLDHATDIREFPPGHYYDPRERTFECFATIDVKKPRDIPAEEAAMWLRGQLTRSVNKRISIGGEVGSWLSGGLDSSAMAALARKELPCLKTFAVGVPGAPDLEAAREVAKFIDASHKELVVTLDDMLKALPDVIYHLESFDALLVRSSVTNFIVGKLAADHVDSVFSGEGGDELFAGYEFLKELPPDQLPDELVDITNRLHNTALQRVDRCSAAHALVVHTAFLDKDVIDCALQIPHEYKLMRNGSLVEKWILRRSVDGLLPENILNRPKAKFWEGAGVTDLMEQHANESISDEEFIQERNIPGGVPLNTKEELFYYRIFREHFGELDDLTFVGRTKGAPVTV